jgi:hypothetical protein
MLNEQSNDPNLAGIAQLVEENFINVNNGDHPVQALNALERGNLDPKKCRGHGGKSLRASPIMLSSSVV